jgi:3-oxoadipate enol-lactonase
VAITLAPFAFSNDDEFPHMPFLNRPHGQIHYDFLDATLPWITDPPTMLFHHGVGTDMGTWAGWIRHLCDQVRVLRMDMVGHGHSSRPDASQPLSFETLADDAHAVLQVVGAKRVILAGESLGGTLMLHMAAMERIKPLAIVTCSTSHLGGSLENVNAWRRRVAEDGFQAWSDDMMKRRFTDDVITPEMANWYSRTQASSDGATILALADLLIGTDLTPQLSDIIAPTLLFAPGASPFIPIEVPRKLADALPNARLHEFPDMRHGVVFSHAEECATMARAFLIEHGVVRED